MNLLQALLMLPHRCNIIVLMLSDTPAVANVLFGEGGMAGHLQPDSLIIDMGTTAVAATRDYAQRLAKREVAYRLKSVIELPILITAVLNVKIAHEHLTRVEIEAPDGEKMNEIAE